MSSNSILRRGPFFGQVQFTQDFLHHQIANMAFIGGRTNRRISASNPVEYLEKIVAEQGEEALTSQFVPLDRNLWKIENYKQFLEARRELLIKHINEFLK